MDIKNIVSPKDRPDVDNMSKEELLSQVSGRTINCQLVQCLFLFVYISETASWYLHEAMGCLDMYIMIVLLMYMCMCRCTKAIARDSSKYFLAMRISMLHTPGEYVPSRSFLCLHLYPMYMYTITLLSLVS